jgi:hypothetical protein
MYFSAIIYPKTSIFLILMCSITNINAKRDRTRRGAADPVPFPVGNGHHSVGCPLGMIVPRTASPNKKMAPLGGGISPPRGEIVKKTRKKIS